MDIKKRVSWGVGFGSLALVAGIVSYFGLSNEAKANNSLETKSNGIQQSTNKDRSFTNSSFSQNQNRFVPNQSGFFTTTGGT